MRLVRRFLPVLAIVAFIVGVVLVAPAAAGPDDADDSNSSDNRAEVIDGEEVLSGTCADSDLPEHSGFQVAPACVHTEMGDVTKAADNPQLLIVDAPKTVKAGDNIVLKVSTRNLVRDRFLPAGQGGYYLERAHLDGATGLTRGHFHTACRLLEETDEAPEPERNQSFRATEDGEGGADPDVVTITLPGLQKKGIAQCASWAGDASHRMPLMQFANQIPAFDSVRVKIN
jgi:hypothetical protein